MLTRRLLRGTHRDDFMGVAPTGKLVTAGGVWLAHLSRGKIKEQWVYFDALGLLQQMGRSQHRVPAVSHTRLPDFW